MLYCHFLSLIVKVIFIVHFILFIVRFCLCCTHVTSLISFHDSVIKYDMTSLLSTSVTRSPLIVFVALGTRGDVQPILALASSLVGRPWTSPSSSLSSNSSSTSTISHDANTDVIRCALVTHEELRECMTPYLHRNGRPSNARVQFRAIRSPCFQRPVQPQDVYGHSTSEHTNDNDNDNGWDIAAEQKKLERADCVDACQVYHSYC
jgi:hypothetical protein